MALRFEQLRWSERHTNPSFGKVHEISRFRAMLTCGVKVSYDDATGEGRVQRYNRPSTRVGFSYEGKMTRDKAFEVASDFTSHSRSVKSSY